ncbi:hypothetical protein FA743_18200 [Paracoccus gahaiensis]|uniref:Uncharacterized protein n=1 Tax=Paracoccus gahaiensis TaxID=1706839 RepID=A0A4U0R463_9RHOB|nr:hypothetical protein [Paracoccus gahaiensis]TJZ89609.1 hypothetical protein FA743_18200 [Paracoccus gahaiensis]
METERRKRFDEAAVLIRLIKEMRGKLDAAEAELDLRSNEIEAPNLAGAEALSTGTEDRTMMLQANVDSLNAALQAERETRFQETAILTRLLEESKRNNKDLRRYQAELLSSTSWRLTVPVRRAKDILLSLRGRK